MDTKSIRPPGHRSSSQTRVITVNVPAMGSDTTATITRATESFFRVAVRNVGGSVCMLAMDVNSLSDVAAQDVYHLPAGATETFVLAPNQGLFATSVGANGRLSAAISEAIPMKWMES